MKLSHHRYSLTALAAVAALAFLAAPVAAQAPPADPLAKLERELAAKADDLKLGNDYRVAVMQAKAYDRGIAFFEELVAKNPSAPNAFLNFGFQYVDKIPVAGSITQVLLANHALTQFTKSLELKPSWIGYYTRGNSYLYWPRIFGRTKLGIADLEEALKMQKAEPKRSYHVRVYVSLGDGYWKMNDLAKATATWQEGLAAFPDSAALKQRLSVQGAELEKLLDSVYDPNKRVDTNLHELWAK